jgi:hypothetical protein
VSASVSTIPAELAPRGFGKLPELRLIPRIETYPQIVSFAQTAVGKLTVLTLFGLGLLYSEKNCLPVIASLAVISFVPKHRRILVSLATLIFAVVVPWNEVTHPLYRAGLLAIVFASGAVLFYSAGAWSHTWYGRRPVFFFLSGFLLLVLVVSQVPQEASYSRVAWDLINALAAYVWFIGYSLLDRSAPGCDPYHLQVGSYCPFWGSTHTPFAKGAAYLRRIEAQDAEQLAVTQLKGLKLLTWSILLSLFQLFFDYVVHTCLRIPLFQAALYLSATHNAPPWYVCWGSMVTGFLGGILTLTIWGHRFIAICRMAGFNALRNTYRPLSSRTIAEFFSRYYFYFKELLVDVFFYPFFVRYFKKNRKIRLAGAIFAAACFGNAFYHFTRDLGPIQQLGLRRALVNYQVFLFYCVILATAITISQLRRRKPVSGFIRGQLWPSFVVVLFYCFLDVFGSTNRTYPLVEHFRFLGHLFNLNF